MRDVLRSVHILFFHGFLKLFLIWYSSLMIGKTFFLVFSFCFFIFLFVFVVWVGGLVGFVCFGVFFLFSCVFLGGFSWVFFRFVSVFSLVVCGFIGVGLCVFFLVFIAFLVCCGIIVFEGVVCCCLGFVLGCCFGGWFFWGGLLEGFGGFMGFVVGWVPVGGVPVCGEWGRVVRVVRWDGVVGLGGFGGVEVGGLVCRLLFFVGEYDVVCSDCFLVEGEERGGVWFCPGLGVRGCVGDGVGVDGVFFLSEGVGVRVLRERVAGRVMGLERELVRLRRVLGRVGVGPVVER